MAIRRSPLRCWVFFAGCVLAVVVLDWAEPVLLPVAVSLLLTFLLNPPVNSLQRWIGRAAAVIVVVTLTFAGLAGLGWVLTRQVSSLVAELPGYRTNIQQKVLDVRRAFRGGPMETVQSTLQDIQQEIAKSEKTDARAAKAPQPVVMATDPGLGLGLPTWMSSLTELLAAGGLTTVLVVFMLLEQRDMRDRLVSVIGIGQLAPARKAFDEAAARLSRYLLMQSIVNVLYGVMVVAGLWWLHVPYPLLWGALGALLRFIPYVGPWIATGAPLLVAFATLPGWMSTFWVLVLFIAIELFTNLVLETVLYAGAAGVTQVALIIALAFWTWLWGPMGLLLATPLTVCLVVFGKHVPGLEVLATLIADEPTLTPEARLYQRLLAREDHDARLIVEEQLRECPREQLFDQLFRPALAHLERDRRRGRLTREEARAIADMAQQIAEDLGAAAPAAH
jgi:predicted PurR-regulated permease PerM